MTAQTAYTETARPTDWPEPDLAILDNQRQPVPAVPVGQLPQPWAAWISETERMIGAPADYTLQSVLAGVASLCGAAVRVRVTPAWDEPLVHWAAAVGEAAAGKSTALAPMRRLLDLLERERCERPGSSAASSGPGTGDSQAFPILTSDADPASLADIVAGNGRGALLWRDGAGPWLGDIRDDGDKALWLAAWMADPVTMARPRQLARSAPRFAVSVLETLRPDALKASLQSGDESLATRFLFVWPGPQPYRTLVAFASTHEAEILQRLKALSRLGESADKPCQLSFDSNALSALDGVAAQLHAERQKAEGLEAAWLGRSRIFIARLAALLELLAVVDGRGGRPGPIGRVRVDAAARLWLDYYWPHARGVFDSAGLTIFDRQVRRAARWLCDTGAELVSREDIRKRALCMSVTASETDQVLHRLDELGFVKPEAVSSTGAGRPAKRWRINPVLSGPALGET